MYLNAFGNNNNAILKEYSLPILPKNSNLIESKSFSDSNYSSNSSEYSLGEISKSHSKNSVSKSRSKNSVSRSHSKDLLSKSHSKNSVSKSHSKDLLSKSHSNNSLSKSSKFFKNSALQLEQASTKTEIKTILKSVIEKLGDETLHQSFVSSHLILKLPFNNEKFQKYNFKILEIIFSSTTANLNDDFIKTIKSLSKKNPNEALSIFHLYFQNVSEPEESWIQQLFHKRNTFLDTNGVLFLKIVEGIYPNDGFESYFKQTFLLALSSSDPDVILRTYSFLSRHNILYDEELPLDSIYNHICNFFIKNTPSKTKKHSKSRSKIYESSEDESSLEEDSFEEEDEENSEYYQNIHRKIAESAVEFIQNVKEENIDEDIILACIKASKHNQKVVKTLKKFFKNKQLAIYAVEQTSWIKNPRPTYQSTISLVIELLKHKSIKKRLIQDKNIVYLVSSTIYEIQEDLQDSKKINRKLVRNLTKLLYLLGNTFYNSLLEVKFLPIFGDVAEEEEEIELVLDFLSNVDYSKKMGLIKEVIAWLRDGYSSALEAILNISENKWGSKQLKNYHIIPLLKQLITHKNEDIIEDILINLQ